MADILITEDKALLAVSLHTIEQPIGAVVSIVSYWVHTLHDRE